MSKNLEQCPICHAEAKVGYACGDYFMYCSEGCPSPACDHPSESTTICSWNDWAKWYRNRRAAPKANEALTLEELREMDGEPVWAGNEKEPQHFQWFFVDCGSGYKPFILINCHNNLMWQYMKSPAHPNGWTAYRRPPEGEEKP